MSPEDQTSRVEASIEQLSIASDCCPICDSRNWQVFVELPDLPIFCNVFWPDAQAAYDCSKGNLQLAFCSDCGFIGNVAFEASRLTYTEAYENALDFSPRFQHYAQELATQLLEKHQLYEKDLIEIGCGKGEFLISLCQLGQNRGIGFDPTYVSLPEHETYHQVQFIPDLYSKKYAETPADFIYCRHTLEHVRDPMALLKVVRESVGDRPSIPIFFEVPNSLATFSNLAIWDLIYEHCGYFTPASLSHAFSAAGFEVQTLWTAYQDQFLCLDATVGSAQTPSQNSDALKHLTAEIQAFPQRLFTKLQDWKNQVDQIVHRQKRAVVWGGGSKGVTFLNLLQCGDAIAYVVDINPRKQGRFIPGTGQEIVAPAFLRTYQPDVVLVMNGIYADEIRHELEEMRIQAEVVIV